MSTLIGIGARVRAGHGSRRSAVARSGHPHTVRFVERTTTTVRELILDDPACRQPGSSGARGDERRRRGMAADQPGDNRADFAAVTGAGVAAGTGASVAATTRVRGFDRIIVRVGIWLIGIGGHQVHRSRSAPTAEEIAERLEVAHQRDLEYGFGLPGRLC